MKFGFQVREALINLRVSLLRSSLAVLGILVGTASVVAMVSGGELATRQILDQFKSLGTNLLAVQLYDNSSSSSGGASKTIPLTYKQAMGVENISSDITAAAPYISVFSPVTYQGHSIQGSVTGATRDLGRMVKLNLKEGRFVSYIDGYQRYAVIGNQIYNKIKTFTVKDPIGQQVKIGDDLYTIVGVTQAWQENPFIFEDLNYTILVPIESSRTLSKNADINNILLRLQAGTNITDVENKIKRYFSSILPDKQIYFRSAEVLVSHMKNQQSILTLFLGFVGGISLLVGGIGVMNIMLVSITERRREIGIRMAIGAKRRDIQSLFLIEGVILSVFGGVLGVILGVLISLLIALIKSWPFTLFLLPPLIGFCVSVAVGIFFSFYPAYKASKLDPIETLHAD